MTDRRWETHGCRGRGNPRPARVLSLGPTRVHALLAAGAPR
jgi:hypothetical protein